ncbi:PspC domain-containing protein [Rhodanobacter sp. MP1X3]|uniref:PspC domain-containing protein n=1 Tax=unclassified Rhodanobacter TaxID=2621553 RepID=UPI0031B88DF4
MMNTEKRLYRSRTNRTLAGVCAGIADYFGWDPTLVRIAWILLTLLGGSGILIYVILWLVVPEAS